ncbi:hypothetical protein FQR65_LT04951 [Abscondita terminalis]|nr:hypothetical protein FQR65_LT04951 [Abscondita terminalis]
MDFNLNVRLKQLESLEQYISSSWNKVNSVLDQLKWSIKDVVKDSQLVKCSVDPTHRVHAVNADDHITKCVLRKEGYKLDEEFLSEPLHKINSSIIIDDDKKIDILSNAHKSVPNFKSGWNGKDPDPKTTDRLTSTFSTDERLALYSYAVANTIGPSKLPDFNIVRSQKSDGKPLSYEELLKQERDAKRRRIKYRSVHTSRKNHTEVLREVIDGQMELYKDWLENKDAGTSKSQGSNDREENRSSSVISRNSTHSSSKSTNSYLKSDRRSGHRKRHSEDDYKSHRNRDKSYSSRHSHDREKYNYNGSRKR